MLSFTDAELQKKFCEGFTFYPFKSLEQHGTLIYKSYAGKGDLKKVLEWNNMEYDGHHYAIKITRKIRQTDIPAAASLLQMVEEAGSWCETHLLSGKKLSADFVQYHAQLSRFHQEALQPVAAKLADKYQHFSRESILETEERLQQFIQLTDQLYDMLKDTTGKKRSFAPGNLKEENREYLSRVTVALNEFRELQERNIYLFDAWQTQLALATHRRSMN